MNFGEMIADINGDLSGLPSRMVKSSINKVYQNLPYRWPFVALEELYDLTTVADYDTGTITITVGSTTLTGSGTTFTSAMVGREVRLDDEDALYTISAYVGATELTLDRAYAGSANLSGDDYVIFKRFYTLDSTMVQLVDISYDRPLIETDATKLDYRDANRTSTGSPTHYVQRGVVSGTQKVEIWPVPLSVYNLKYIGVKVPTALSADSDVPLVDSYYILCATRMALLSKYIKLNPHEANIIRAQIPLWREQEMDAYQDLLGNDTTIRTDRRHAKDNRFGSTNRVGEAFWIDRDMEVY